MLWLSPVSCLRAQCWHCSVHPALSGWWGNADENRVSNLYYPDAGVLLPIVAQDGRYPTAVARAPDGLAQRQ
ncbi:hypothetical protein XNC3_860021 [Xenorhabdus nematophila F1]|nr:hypothetical protein XNC3_860021 [Xenorhabdus nematophila F1]